MLNCEDAYGFPPYPAIERSLCTRNGKDLREVERAIVAGALSGRPAAVMRSETMDWWRRVPELVGRWTEPADADGATARAPHVLVGRKGDGTNGSSPGA
jgi:hypothetical protein